MFLRRLSVFITSPVVCGTLLVGMPTPARADPLPSSPSAVAQSAPTRLTGTLQTPPSLSLSGHLISPGRAGGRGIFDVVLASTSAGGQKIDGLEVRLAAPPGTAFRSVSGSGWRCSTPNRPRVAICAHRRTLGRDESPAHIRAVVKISPAYSSSRAWISGWARWKGERRWEGNWVVAERNAVPVFPKATLRLTAANSKVTVFGNGTSRQRQFQLLAELGRLQGQHATLTWRQVGGPRAILRSPRKVEGVADVAEQIVEVRKTPERQRYDFEATVVAQGQVMRRRVSVVALGGTLLGEVSAASPGEAAIAEATELDALGGANRVKSIHDLRITGPLLAKASSSVTLTAAGAESRFGRPRWFVDGRPVAEGRVLHVTAPTTPGDARLVTAQVRLPSGVVMEAGHVLVATGSTVGPRSGSLPRRGSPFCQIATSIRKAQADGSDGTRVLPVGPNREQRFTFTYDKAVIGEDVFDGAGECTDAGEIAIAKATFVQSDNVRFGSVTATLTAGGLEMTKARITVNSTLANRLTDRLGLDVVGSMVTPFAGDALYAMSGSATFTPVAIGDAKPVSPFSLFLDEPDGWENLPDASRVEFDSDQTVRLVQVLTSPPNVEGTRATASMAIDIAGDAPTKAKVTLADLTLGQTPRGGLLMANGSAMIDFTGSPGSKSFELEVPITCASGWDSQACELFGGVRFGAMALKWTQSRIRVEASAAISFSQSKTYSLNLVGEYRQERDWDIAVTNAAPWNLGQGMTFRDLTGKISSTPKGEAADLTISITGTFSGLSLGTAAKVTKVTPKLTNECPTARLPRPEGAPACSLSEIKLFLDAEIEATLPGKSSPATFSARADVNLSTLDFQFESGVSSLDVGPKALKLQDLRVILSRGVETPCSPTGVDPPKQAGVTLRFVGAADVLNVRYEVNVQSDRRGLCLWGSGDTIDLGGGLAAVSPVLAYTTYADGATVDGIDIEPNSIKLYGGFLFPDSLSDRFKVPGEGVTFEAGLSLDLTKANFRIQYRPAGDITLYRGDGSNLTLDSVGFGADLTMPAGAVPTVDAYFFGRGLLTIEGTPSSTTPLDVRIGLQYSGTQFKVLVQGGVPSGEGPVLDAFGVAGLTVRELSVSAAFDVVTTTPSMALNADVSLPDGWASSVGVADGTRVALAANLDAVKPCLRFAIGAERGADVVDVGGLGFLTANYVQLLLAPMGCQVPSGAKMVAIEPGWGISLQGRVLGSPVAVSANVTIGSRGIRLKTTIEVEEFDLYGVAFRSQNGFGDPKVKILIDTMQGLFEAGIDASIEIGNVALGAGLVVGVEGTVGMTDDAWIVNLKGKAARAVGPVSLSFDRVQVDANIPRVGGAGADNLLWVVVSTDVTAGLDLAGLGSYSITASGKLHVQGATVVELRLSSAGTFDAVVYEVTGTIELNLCTGSLSKAVADGTGNECTPFADAELSSARPAVRVSVFGSQKWAFKAPKPYVKVFYDRAPLVRAA